MAERKSLDGLTLSRQHGTTLMALAAMEIWDGADLSLLRDGMNHVILKEKHRSVAIDMTFVKYVPSGFFGMLYDWYEKGVTIRLYAPQERVINMLWFRQFFAPERDSWYILQNRVAVKSAAKSRVWDEEEWASQDRPASAVTAGH